MYKSGFRWLVVIVMMLNGLLVIATSPASAAGIKDESAMRLAATGDGSPGDSNIKYVGRWDTSNLSNVKSYWSGAYFSVNFTGTTLSIRLAGAVNMFAVIDGVTRYFPGANGTVNLTPTPLASGTHSLRIIARSEYDTIQFQGLVLSSGASTQLPAAKSKLIEFVGDSITAGCCTLTNWALNDYAWLTGEALNANHTQIAFSGICLQNAANCGENNIGMSVQFFKLQTIHYTNSPAWDFNRYQANQVVINLGTNDWNTSDATLQSTYITFLQNVRAKYPNAEIFVLRTFGGYKAALTQAAVNARISAGDSKIRYVDTTGWVTSGDFDSDNLHPTMNGHIKIANRLTPILSAGIGPTPTPVVGANFLTNANMESGTTNWVVNGAGTLSSDTSQFHGGSRSVKITGRTSAWNGIGQNVAVSNFPTSGQNYTVSVWVRSQTGTPTAKATVRLTAGSTVTFINLASATVNANGWTLVSGTVPVSWSGTLSGVLFYVETAAGTDNIYIDDASLHR
jgi:lysophospholipase L1-like esterase